MTKYTLQSKMQPSIATRQCKQNRTRIQSLYINFATKLIDDRVYETYGLTREEKKQCSKHIYIFRVNHSLFLKFSQFWHKDSTKMISIFMKPNSTHGTDSSPKRIDKDTKQNNCSIDAFVYVCCQGVIYARQHTFIEYMI